LIVNVPVRKPDKADFIRVHPSPEYQLTTTVAQDPDTRDQFLVLPRARGVLADLGDFKTVLLRLYVNRRGDVGLWPLTVPKPNSSPNSWVETARSAATEGEKRWVRLVSDMPSQSYKIFAAIGDIEEPQWPADTFSSLLDKAFRDRIISDQDHPLVRRLRGET
jgi:hypothetical protein